MDNKTQEQVQEQRTTINSKYNPKSCAENQNQTHNSRKEGIQPINQKR